MEESPLSVSNPLPQIERRRYGPIGQVAERTCKNMLLFFSSIVEQWEHSSISRDGSHWIIHKRKQNARNEVKPLKLNCRSLSFHKCLACNLSNLPSLDPIYIRKHLVETQVMAMYVHVYRE